jgi:hypothetical protein
VEKPVLNGTIIGGIIDYSAANYSTSELAQRIARIDDTVLASSGCGASEDEGLDGWGHGLRITILTAHAGPS